MLDKLKLLYKLSPAILALLLVFAGYVVIDLREEKANAIELADKTQREMNYLHSEINRYSDLSTIAEQEKTKLENESQLIQEQLNDALKSNQCSNEPVPDSVASSLYNKANRIRQAAIDTSKFIK